MSKTFTFPEKKKDQFVEKSPISSSFLAHLTGKHAWDLEAISQVSTWGKDLTLELKPHPFIANAFTCKVSKLKQKQSLVLNAKIVKTCGQTSNLLINSLTCSQSFQQITVKCKIRHECHVQLISASKRPLKGSLGQVNTNLSASQKD